MKLFTGKNILLRPIEPEDLQHIQLWENDTDLWHVSHSVVPFSRYIIHQYIGESHKDITETKQLRLIIESTSDNQAIGAVDLFDYESIHRRAGIGILIYKAANRNKGYATEALELMLKYCSQGLMLHQLYCNISVDNLESIALFEKMSFTRTGTRKDWIRKQNGWTDVYFYQKIID